MTQRRIFFIATLEPSDEAWLECDVAAEALEMKISLISLNLQSLKESDSELNHVATIGTPKNKNKNKNIN